MTFFFFFFNTLYLSYKKELQKQVFFLNYSLHITNTPLKLKHELNYTKITKKIYSHLKKITNKYKHTYIGKKKKKKKSDKTRKPTNGLVFLFFFFSFSLVLFFPISLFVREGFVSILRSVFVVGYDLLL